MREPVKCYCGATMQFIERSDLRNGYVQYIGYRNFDPDKGIICDIYGCQNCGEVEMFPVPKDQDEVV